MGSTKYHIRVFTLIPDMGSTIYHIRVFTLIPDMGSTLTTRLSTNVTASLQDGQKTGLYNRKDRIFWPAVNWQ
jgi:hypothetical protein